jgi:DNA-binding Lrp family transcriptional regulator
LNDAINCADNANMSKDTSLDRLDLRILAQLQTHGRLTYQQLGDSVGLSASPCLQRVKRLEKQGFIEGYGAWVAVDKLQEMTGVFTSVTLNAHTQLDFVRFEDHLRKHPELLECHLVSGGFDYLLKWSTRSIAHYQQIIEDLLKSEAGINKYFSYIVIKSPIVQRFTPLRIH